MLHAQSFVALEWMMWVPTFRIMGRLRGKLASAVSGNVWVFFLHPVMVLQKHTSYDPGDLFQP